LVFLRLVSWFFTYFLSLTVKAGVAAEEEAVMGHEGVQPVVAL